MSSSVTTQWAPRIFDLLVTNTYDVMSNDVLISVPLFLFMGYVVDAPTFSTGCFIRCSSPCGVAGPLAVATLTTCALFATATGIVGAVVTLMGLLAFPAMFRRATTPKFLPAWSAPAAALAS